MSGAESHHSWPDGVVDTPDKDDHDPHAERIIAAALELLHEGGLRAVTTDAIASRANVSKTTIYRRWSDRTGVLVAAVRRAVQPVEVEDVRDLEAEVRVLLTRRLEQYADPGVARVFASVVGAMVDDQQVAEAFQEWAGVQRGRNVAMIQRAIDRGQLDGQWCADDLATVIAAPLLFRLIVERRSVDQCLIDTVVRVVAALLGSSAEQRGEVVHDAAAGRVAVGAAASRSPGHVPSPSTR
jgi:AcrR family transcriptional regulator